MDALSKFFTAPRIREAKFTRLEASAPWGIVSPGEPVVKFVYVVTGSASLITPEQAVPTRLESGDVFVLLQDAAYRIFDHERSLLIDCGDVERTLVENGIKFGGAGATTIFISGSFEMERLGYGYISDVLPPFLHLGKDAARTESFSNILNMLAVETSGSGLGSDAAVARLFELLFIHAIRAYVDDHGSEKRGWLAALADVRLKSVVGAVHADPSKDWTVRDMARIAGMSRSAFAARFKSVLGQSPLEYLTAWRVYCASALLTQSATPISEIAFKTGYGSDAAFNKVFKRMTGYTPATFRRGKNQELPT